MLKGRHLVFYQFYLFGGLYRAFWWWMPFNPVPKPNQIMDEPAIRLSDG